MRPLGVVYLQGVTKVADLMVAAGDAWNTARLDEMFSPDDAQDIKQIAIGGPVMQDVWLGILQRMAPSRCGHPIT